MALQQMRVPWYLAIVGTACLIPILVWDWSHTLTATDYISAFRRPIKIPLDSLKNTGAASIQFGVPVIKSEADWGSPFYSVFWVSRDFAGKATNSEAIHNFSALKMDVVVAVNGVKAQVNEGFGPYGYSADSQNIGISFPVKPGDVVRIDFQANDPRSLPNGELVVLPDWTKYNKDTMVGDWVGEFLHRIFGMIALAGVILIASALVRIRRLNR